MCPGQDTLVLTELGQLSPQAVTVPGHLFRHAKITQGKIALRPIWTVKDDASKRLNYQCAHLFELSGQPLALLLYGNKFKGLRGQRRWTWRGEGTMQWWCKGPIDLLLQEC